MDAHPVFHLSVEQNKKGRDFVVGDIHGHFDELMVALDAAGFERDKDRLFAVGDLIDRGTKNIEVLELMEQPWFFSTMGNHEDMFLGRFVDLDPYDSAMHAGNGGKWADNLEHDKVDRCISLIRRMPWAISLVTPWGTVGIVHAEVRKNNWLMQQQMTKPQHECLWNLNKFGNLEDEYYSPEPVSGVDIVVSGHVNCEQITHIDNHFFIDVLGRSGQLAVLPVSDLFLKDDWYGRWR